MWNIYLVVYEGGAVSRLVGSVRSSREPVRKLKAMREAHADLYEGKWELYARPADSDPWSRP